MINSYNDQEYFEYVKSQELDRQRKTPLLLAILGLFFGVFMGVGFIFSLASIITYFVNKPLKGTSLKWGIVLGVIGLVLNFAFIISLIIISMLSQTPMPL